MILLCCFCLDFIDINSGVHPGSERLHWKRGYCWTSRSQGRSWTAWTTWRKRTDRSEGENDHDHENSIPKKCWLQNTHAKLCHILNPWLFWVQGEPGLRGDRGASGMKGLMGATGDQGREGEMGAKGQPVSIWSHLLLFEYPFVEMQLFSEMFYIHTGRGALKVTEVSLWPGGLNTIPAQVYRRVL